MKILITYASERGATGGIAHAIGDFLAASGHDMTVTPIGDQSDLGAFDAAVVGSAVYSGHWLDEARHFIEANRDTLAKMPVWLFTSGPVGSPLEEPEETRQFALMIGAHGTRSFGGALDESLLDPAERTIVKTIELRGGDYRNWTEVREWTMEIFENLGALNKHGTSPE
jgi:menaquinone-dependent protoporphyrinogen oxidase